MWYAGDDGVGWEIAWRLSGRGAFGRGEDGLMLRGAGFWCFVGEDDRCRDVGLQVLDIASVVAALSSAAVFGEQEKGCVGACGWGDHARERQEGRARGGLWDEWGAGVGAEWVAPEAEEGPMRGEEGWEGENCGAL